MAWIILTPLLLAGAFLAWRWARHLGDEFAVRTAKKEDPNDSYRGVDDGDLRAGSIALKVVAGLAIGGFLLMTCLSSLHSIAAGHVGVVKTFGRITSQTGDGFTMIAPWKDLTSVSTRVQKAHFDNINAFSQETQDVFIDATVNLSVAPGAIQKLYRTVGPDWYDKLVPPRVNQTVKDETVKFRSVSIAPNRETIRRDVRRRLEDQLRRYSINVQDFLLDNITFPQAFTDAILRKQVATQDAQTAQNRVQVATAEARQKIATAHGSATSAVIAATGDAQATVLNATGQAKANKLLSQSLTPELIQFTAIQKLNPNVQTVIVPSGSNFILPSSVVGK